MSLRPFHIAVPVHDLTAARQFYGELLGCPEGRSSDRWIDFDLYGHQFVCHYAGEEIEPAAHNEVDGENVPVPHYGVVLVWSDWEALAEALQKSGIEFIIKPNVRFAGEPGEQATLFIADPSGNVLEFKAMRHPEKLFSK
jgi:extradiol dioxygenase family protein